MAVTQATARKAVQRWQLDGGQVGEAACGCRFWRPRLNQVNGARPVYTCPAHRLPGG